MRIKAEVDIKKEEDLNKYIDELPTCESFAQRLFLINGIKNLFNDIPFRTLKGNAKELLQKKKKQGYTLKQIQKKCCVPRGELTNPEYEYRIIIGCKYGF